MTMSGQHVGAVSDAVGMSEEEEAYRRSSAARLAAVAKPQGKKFTRRPGDNGMGDGDLCPVEGHGKMYVLTGTKQQWCAVQSHDMGQPRDASGNEWVDPRTRKEARDA